MKVIFVVDSVNKEKDFRARAIWTEINRYLPKVPVIIVANKVDLKRARSVDQLRQDLPFLSGMPVIPISAKTGYNVNNVVRAVVLLFIMEWSQLFQILSKNSGKKHAFTATANMLGIGQKKTTQILRWLESRSLIDVNWENQSFKIKNPVLNAVRKPALIFST